MTSIMNADLSASMYMSRKVGLFELCTRYGVKQFWGNTTDIFNGVQKGEFIITTSDADEVSELIDMLYKLLGVGDTSKLEIVCDKYEAYTWGYEEEGFKQIYDVTTGILI